jgi:hypothetical protein
MELKGCVKEKIGAVVLKAHVIFTVHGISPLTSTMILAKVV